MQLLELDNAVNKHAVINVWRRTKVLNDEEIVILTSTSLKIPTILSVHRWFELLSLAVLLCLFAGCASKDSRPDGDRGDDNSIENQRSRKGNLSTDGLTMERVDLNGDNKPDQWLYSTPSGLVRVERDLNFDGKVDMWQYFDASGVLVEEEMDLDLDGKVDMVTFYQNGVLTRKMLALGFDGVFSIVKFYDDDAKLLRIERDENGDGSTDSWEYYEDGKRVRMGWDTIGDGVPDTFDQL